MPVAREDDFSFCLARFPSNASYFVNPTDMNWIYVKSSSVVCEENQGPAVVRRNISVATSEKSPELHELFIARVKESFPNVKIVNDGIA